MLFAEIKGSPLRCLLARVATVELVFILTVRTKPSRLTITSRTRPRGHLPLGKDSSTNRTRSPTLRFLLVSFHFLLFKSVGKYCRIHLCQNRPAKYCACRQARLQLLSSLLNTPGGSLGHDLRCNTWLGLSAVHLEGYHCCVRVV